MYLFPETVYQANFGAARQNRRTRTMPNRVLRLPEFACALGSSSSSIIDLD
jgi:hypothetical protein